MNCSRLDALIMEQEGLQTLTREDIRRIQLDKLNALLRLEHERGGFYSALPQHLKSLHELASLPFTMAADLSERGGEMLLLSQAKIQRVITDVTSSTTGSAKRVFYTSGDCENTVRLFMAGLGELVFPGSRTMICMPFSGENGLGELIAEAITRLGAYPLRLGASLSYGELKAAASQHEPDTYVGMPTALLAYLRVCGRGSLRRALISGDACPSSVAAAVEDILGSRLFPHYGSREMGLGGAVTCPAHEGMHLRENHVIAEIVDPEGRSLPCGERGELVITTVGMEAMPLIRYRTGDITRIIPERCRCGSATLRLDNVSRSNGLEMTELDDALFRLPDMVDYRAEMSGGKLRIFALTTGEPQPEIIAAASGAKVVEVRRVRMSDVALYDGKRRIECGTCVRTI